MVQVLVMSAAMNTGSLTMAPDRVLDLKNDAGHPF